MYARVQYLYATVTIACRMTRFCCSMGLYAVICNRLYNKYPRKRRMSFDCMRLITTVGISLNFVRWIVFIFFFCRDIRVYYSVRSQISAWKPIGLQCAPLLFLFEKSYLVTRILTHWRAYDSTVLLAKTFSNSRANYSIYSHKRHVVNYEYFMIHGSKMTRVTFC